MRICENCTTKMGGFIVDTPSPKVNIRVYQTRGGRKFAVYAVKKTRKCMGRQGTMALVGEGLSRPKWVPLRLTSTSRCMFTCNGMRLCLDDFKPA